MDVPQSWSWREERRPNSGWLMTIEFLLAWPDMLSCPGGCDQRDTPGSIVVV